LVFAPSVFAALTAALLFLMAFRPAIETHEGYLAIGKRIIPWMDIRRLDRTGWISPLIVRVTLFDDSRLVVIYPAIWMPATACCATCGATPGTP
jgi:hypothetical protein